MWRSGAGAAVWCNQVNATNAITANDADYALAA